MAMAMKSFMGSVKRTVSKAGGSMQKDTLKEQVTAFQHNFTMPPGEKILAIGKCELALPHGSFYGIL